MIVIGHLNQSDAGHWSELKKTMIVHWILKVKAMLFIVHTLVSKKEDNDCR